MDRRTALTLAGVSFVTPLSGCLSRISDSDTRLHELSVSNRRDTAETLHLKLTADDETVYDRELELTADSGELIPCQWPEEASAYTITAELSGGGENTAVLDDGDDICYMVTVSNDQEKPLFQIWDPCPRPGRDSDAPVCD